MEAVLKLKAQGILMPWREVMRGCLVIALFGILYLCVQNYAQRCEAAESVPVSCIGKYSTAAAWREAGLSRICENIKPLATDMRKGMAGFDAGLGEAVKPAPVQNTWETEPSFITTEVTYVLPEIGLGLAGGQEPTDFTVVPDTPSVPPAVFDDGSEDMRWIESVITEDTPISDPTDTTEENVVPEMPEITEEPVFPEEIAGFLLDAEGYITGYTEQAVVRDDLLVIPESESLIGIRSGALAGLGESVTEVYLPANISHIEPGAFDGFPYLMFVEVSGDNPYYYSLDGILYSISGEEIFCPAGRIME